MVVWQHSRWMFAKADCAKNLQIENQACLSTLVTTLLSDITFHLLPIWLQTLVAIVSESCLTLFPSFCTTIWSCCAVQFKSEQTPFPQTSCRFRPAALHHILLRDQRLIERLSELRKHWAIPWLARTCCIPSKFSREKSDLLQPEIYKALKPFWLLNWVRLARVVAYFHIFLERASRQLLLPQTLKHPVFVLASPTCASRARELLQELGSWFCPLNLWLPSGTDFGEIARCQARAQTQTWPDQRVVISPEQLW